MIALNNLRESRNAISIVENGGGGGGGGVERGGVILPLNYTNLFPFLL